jgi:two-component system cell cycle response regulator
VDSEDELGESAESFNTLIMTLSEVMETHTEIQLFSEMLTSHLELDVLSRETLIHLIKNTKANGGAILIEKSGELAVEAIDSIKDAATLENNKRVLNTMRTLERQLIKFPDDIILDGVVVDFHPKELIIEPIVYKNILLGILILVSSSSFSSNDIDKLSFFSQSLSLAFRNAITYNQMQRLAALDALTGLYNRRFGILRIQEEFSRAIRASTPISLLMFDIDHFKNVNDTYGHLVGDKVLVSIAKIALASIREGDVLLRYGGEEFLCVLPGANKVDASIIAERIRIIVMDSAVENAEQDIKVTISIGVVTYPRNDISDSNQLIKLADDAMYVAKETGRNRTVSY